MKTWKRSTRITALAVFACSVLSASQVWAQPPDELVNTAPVAELQAKAGSWRSMKLKNVKPSLMAWWIDPKNNPMPLEMRPASILRMSSKAMPERKYKAIVQLVAEAEIVVGVDARNEILAFTDEARWERLRQFVKVLDVPIPAVKIKVYEIETDEKTAAAQGWTANGKLLDVRDKQFETLLENLKAQGKIKIVTQVMVSTRSNFPGVIQNSESVPALLSVVPDGKTLPQNSIDRLSTPTEYPGLYLSASKVVYVIPTVNNDQTITIFAQIASPISLTRMTGEKKSAELLLTTDYNMNTVANIGAGDVQLLGGLFTKTDPEPVRAHLYFISARLHDNQ